MYAQGISQGYAAQMLQGHVFVSAWAGWCGPAETYNGSYCCNHAVILNWSDISPQVQTRPIINKQFEIFILSLIVNKRADLWLFFSSFFFFFGTDKEQSVYCLCLSAAMAVPMPDSKHYSKLPVITQSLICHFLFPLSVCNFIGTGALMWWHALLAVWWRMGWRHTSSQIINAVPGANVLE